MQITRYTAHEIPSGHGAGVVHIPKFSTTSLRAGTIFFSAFPVSSRETDFVLPLFTVDGTVQGRRGKRRRGRRQRDG